MSNYKFLFVFLLNCFCVATLVAQSTKKADQLYNDYGYQRTLDIYETQAGDKELTEEQLVKIANSYRLNHDTENAESWYAEIVKTTSDPIHFFHYAQALQSNGKYTQAKDYYLKYDELNGGNDRRGEVLAAAIDRMNDLQRTDAVINNEINLNSDKLDYSPTYYNNGIVFVSSRVLPKNLNKNVTDSWTGEHYMSLFFSQKNTDGTLKTPEQFSYNLNSRYHEGPVTFSRNSQQIFFTRTTTKKSNDGTLKLQIYSAKKSGDEWGDPSVLTFCNKDYSDMHPALSPDGQRLYFASDREGGFGGMDLYVSKFEGGKWSDPVNLGNKVNTAGNEVFPFMHDDGTLYYSTNGTGIGGLDIVSTVMLNENDWADPINLGLPFNSNKDDFGFILNVLGTEGFLSSARPGGTGGDDIYSFSLPPESIKKPDLVTITANVCAYEQSNDARLQGVKISVFEDVKDGSKVKLNEDYAINLVPTNNDGEFTLKLQKKDGSTIPPEITNKNGEITYKMLPNRNYRFVAEKDGYRMAERTFSTEGMDQSESFSFCLPMVRQRCMTMAGVVTNMFHGNRVPNATVVLTNHCTGAEEQLISNILGEFSFPCVDCSCDFTITTNKDNFHYAASRINVSDLNCDNGGTQNFVIQLASIYDAESSDATVSKSGNQPITHNTTELKAGTKIELDNIYYDFDDYRIRQQAAMTLNQVVGLLRRYPSLELELSAHTDSRGDGRYNSSLSKKRAEAAVNYIADQGIAASRLTARGYGEGQLRNQCEDGLPCNEEEHQYNRRTEIKVTKFDRQDISIQYVDDGPERTDYYQGNRGK